MARIIRQYDPTETLRRITIEIKEANCPGLLEFLSQLPYGHESSLLRAVTYQWFLEHQGNLDQAIANALCGLGGRPDNRLPNGIHREALDLRQAVTNRKRLVAKSQPAPLPKRSTTRPSPGKKTRYAVAKFKE
jgi:membrane carboxypeptidase/penicillin-binding protein PbpC